MFILQIKRSFVYTHNLFVLMMGINWIKDKCYKEHTLIVFRGQRPKTLQYLHFNVPGNFILVLQV